MCLCISCHTNSKVKTLLIFSTLFRRFDEYFISDQHLPEQKDVVSNSPVPLILVIRSMLHLSCIVSYFVVLFFF